MNMDRKPAAQVSTPEKASKQSNTLEEAMEASIRSNFPSSVLISPFASYPTSENIQPEQESPSSNLSALEYVSDNPSCLTIDHAESNVHTRLLDSMDGNTIPLEKPPTAKKIRLLDTANDNDTVEQAKDRAR